MEIRKAEKEVAKFVKILTKIRKEKNVSHEKLAAKAGLSRGIISTTESGKSSPTLRTIIRICDALNIKPSDLLKQIGR